ncbi:MAG: sugar kinase [Lachnospiraceae bacterium]
MKFITIGEIMLRFTPPNYEKIVSTHNFIVNYGGAEANVAVSLACLGVDSTFFTVLPNTDLGKSTTAYLKANDVHTKHIIKADGRMGIYYLEEGVSVRSSQVIYDRANSAFSEYDYTDVDMEEILKDYDWLHVSGITPALSYNCRRLIDKALKAAKKLGLTVSFDPNWRKRLWSFETARDVLSTYLPYVDVLIGIEPIHVYAEDGVTDVKDGLSMQPTFEEMDRVFKAIDRQYHMKAIARTVRYAHSGSNNSLKAYFYTDGRTYESKLMNFDIVDRVGGGDAFSSGLIFALMEGMEPQQVVDFAVCSSVMKHSIHGDTNITSKEAIMSLMNNGSHDIQR